MNDFSCILGDYLPSSARLSALGRISGQKLGWGVGGEKWVTMAHFFEVNFVSTQKNVAIRKEVQIMVALDGRWIKAGLFSSD